MLLSGPAGIGSAVRACPGAEVTGVPGPGEHPAVAGPCALVPGNGAPTACTSASTQPIERHLMQTVARPAPLSHVLDTADPSDLLSRVTAGRPGAWAELVETYPPLLRARTRRYRLQEADAFDVAQATWVRLMENLDRIHTPQHLAGWLATVVSRECLRILRSQGRTGLGFGADPADDGPGPEQVAVAAADTDALRTVIADLPPHRQALLVALFADDRRSYAEIAENLDMPVGSLGPTRSRSLSELRRRLEQRGVTR